MKVTVFNGSPRAEKGNTNIMVEALLDGMRSAGAETENIFLAHKKIKHCLGCFACWLKTPGKCVINDDVAELLPKFQNSDIVVLATPLYFDNVTGIMKNFFDRLIPLADAHFELDENGECRHLKRFEKNPKLVIVSNCGLPEQTHFQTLHLIFKRMARNAHTTILAEIYRGHGEILREPSLILKPIIWNYKRILKHAGKELIEDGVISMETAAALEKPLVSKERYFAGANKHFDKELKKVT